MMRKSWSGLLAGVWVLVLSILGASFLQSTPTAAFGESFRWIGNNAVEMSGGNFNDMLVDGPNKDRPLRFTGSPSGGTWAVYEASRPLTIKTNAGTCRMHLELAFQTTEVDGTNWILPANATLRDSGRYTEADKEAGHESCIAWATGSGPSSGSRAAARAMNAFWNEDCYNTDPGWGEDEYSSCTSAFDRSDAFPGKTVGLTNPSAVYPELASECTSADDAAGYNECVASMLQRQAEGDGIETGDDADPEEAAEGDEPVCTGGAMGWILCPFSTAAVEAMKQVGGIVQGLMLVQPLSIAAPETEPVYIIWNTMRNIANILFIIFFLIIIASYITSMGISNYGIKRTLPRLVIAAILVNISYFICAIMIDLFNIIGSSIEGLFQTGINAAVSSIEGYDGGGASGFQIGAYLALFGTVLAGIIKVAGPSILLLLLPPLISALGAILTLFIILLARQFIITLLVIISPLVAVAWLLPGTEQYFKRGLNLFFSLLVSYPVVMAVIQASSLLVAIIHVNGVAPSIDGGGPSEWLSAIAILLVQVLVAVVVYKVLQTSVRIMNQLGVMGGGFISNLRGGIGGWAKERRGNSRWAMRRKELSDYRSSRARANYDRRQRRAIEKRPGGRSATVFGKRIGFGAGYESLNRAAFQNQSQERKRAEVAAIAKQLETDSAYRKFYSGEGNEARQRAAEATGIKQLQSQRAEELTATKAVLGSVNGLSLKKVFEDSGYLGGRFNNNDSLIAAAQLAIENGEGGSFNAALQRFSQLNESQDPGGEARKEFIRYVEQNMGKVRSVAPAAADQAVRNAVVEGRAVTSDMIQQGTVNTLSKKVKASEVVSWDGEARASVMEAMNTTIPNNISNLESQWASLESELNTARSAGDAVREAQLTEEIRKVTEEITVQEKAYNNVIDAASTAMRSDAILSGAKAEGIDFAREVSSMPRRPDGS